MLLSTSELKDCPVWYHALGVLSWTPALLGSLTVGKQDYFYKQLQNPQINSLAQNTAILTGTGTTCVLVCALIQKCSPCDAQTPRSLSGPHTGDTKQHLNFFWHFLASFHGSATQDHINNFYSKVNMTFVLLMNLRQVVTQSKGFFPTYFTNYQTT